MEKVLLLFAFSFAHIVAEKMREKRFLSTSIIYHTTGADTDYTWLPRLWKSVWVYICYLICSTNDGKLNQKSYYHDTIYFYDGN